MTIPEVRPYTLPYQPSGGLWFDGSSGYVDCGNDSSITNLNPFTLLCWFRITGTYGGSYHTLLSKIGEFIVLISSNGLVRLYTWDLTPNTIDTIKRVDDGLVHFIGCGYDPANGILFMKLDDNDMQITTGVTGTITGTESLSIGQIYLSNFLNGIEYEAAVIAEALTENEIRGLMEGRRLPTEWDCRLWLDFRQGHTRDLSGNGNHGTLYGGVYFV